jgi:hypothetical protein
MVEKKVSEGIAFWVDVRFSAETRWAEEGERLECPQSRLALCDCDCGARDCNREQLVGLASAAAVEKYCSASQTLQRLSGPFSSNSDKTY